MHPYVIVIPMFSLTNLEQVHSIVKHDPVINLYFFTVHVNDIHI